MLKVFKENKTGENNNNCSQLLLVKFNVRYCSL